MKYKTEFMRLYTANSPNSAKVQLALAELGLDYEKKFMVLAKGEHQIEEFGRINPHRKVPVLDVDGSYIAESGAILEYLGRTAGNGKWPDNAAHDAQLSRWLFFKAVHLASACGAIWWNDVLSPRRGAPEVGEARLEVALNELDRSLNVLEESLGGQDYLDAGGFTLADCAVGVAVSMLKGTRINPVEKWPGVAAYGARVRGRTAWTGAEGDRCLHWAD